MLPDYGSNTTKMLSAFHVIGVSVAEGGLPMMLARRQFLRLTMAAATLTLTSHIVRAQAYPTRPVRIVVGFGAGSAADILARLIAQRLSERLSQPFIVEVRSG